MGPPSKKQDKRTQRAGTSLAEIEVQDNGDEDYQEKLQLLTDEYAKDKPKRKTVKNLMKTTFQGRRKWILQDSPPIEDVLKSFPSLKKEKFVSTCTQWS